MEIYPKYLLRKCFRGEAYIRKLLSSLNDDGIVIHSVNLPKHPSKRWGEIDFLVIFKNQVIALEIKGGYVSCKDGVWTYSNSKNTYTSYESPLEQVQSAVIALEKMISTDLGLNKKIFHGIVFPFSTINLNSIYFPNEVVADKNICQDPDLFEFWLNKIISTQNKKPLTYFEINQLKDYLLPKFDISMTRRIMGQLILEQIDEYTEEQKRYFNIIDSNKMIVVYGGAGSGKTELLISTALKEQLKGNHPIILTKHLNLKVYLEERLKDWNIPVSTKEVSDQYNVLLIDEGQDFYSMDLLSPYLKIFEKGKVRIFMDKNYQFMDIPPNLGLLNWYYNNALIVDLDTNVRNTEYMINTVEALIKAQLGLAKVKGIGNKVSIEPFKHDHELPQMLLKAVDHLYRDNIEKTNTVILYQKFDQSIKKSINFLKSNSHSASKFISMNNCKTHLAYTSISDFRGLEADQVILILNEKSDLDAKVLSDIYIGMTRSRIELMILCHSECINKLLF